MKTATNIKSVQFHTKMLNAFINTIQKKSIYNNYPYTPLLL